MPSILTKIRDVWRKKKTTQKHSAEDYEDTATVTATATATATESASDSDIGVSVKVTEFRRPAAEKLLRRISSLRLARPSHWLTAHDDSRDGNRTLDASGDEVPAIKRGSYIRASPSRRLRRSGSHRLRLALPTRLREFLCWPRVAGGRSTGVAGTSAENKDFTVGQIECLYQLPQTPMPSAATVGHRNSLSNLATDKESPNSAIIAPKPVIETPNGPCEIEDEATNADIKPEVIKHEPEVKQERSAEPGSEVNVDQYELEVNFHKQEPETDADQLEPDVKATLEQELEIYADLEQDSEINSEPYQQPEAESEANFDIVEWSPKLDEAVLGKAEPNYASTAACELSRQARPSAAFSEAYGDTRRECGSVELAIDGLSLADEAEYQRLFNRRARTLIGNGSIDSRVRSSSTSAEDTDCRDVEPCPAVFAEVLPIGLMKAAPDARSTASAEGEEPSPGSASCLIATLTRMTGSHQGRLLQLASESLDEPEDSATG
uniref:Ephexin-1 n=1 Tax=Macrostomum lignano TaxID=282301 RepID=A0A1I8JM72_9PLAT